MTDRVHLLVNETSTNPKIYVSVRLNTFDELEQVTTPIMGILDPRGGCFLERFFFLIFERKRTVHFDSNISCFCFYQT